jgi:uncharacterized protein YndB with AHSA1/START domain
MKWLRLILVVLALMILVPVVLLGLLNTREDANRLHSSIMIRQPASTVWPWLYEGDKLKSWVSSLKEVQRDGATPPMAGSRAVWVMADEDNGGQLMRIDSTVESVEPERRLVLRLSAPEGFRGTTTYLLSPAEGGGTRLETDGRFEFESSFAKLMTPVIIWEAKKKSESDLERLRSILETGK